MPEGTATGTTGTGAAASGAAATGTSAIDRLIARHGGDPRKAIASLAEENARRKKQIESARAAGTITVESAELARERDDLRRELDEVSGRLPPAGAVILTGDDATAWNGYRELKLTPAQVKEAVTERETLKVKDAQRSRTDAIRAAAETVNYKPSVLTEIAAARNLVVEMREVTVEVDDGKGGKTTEKQQRPHVKKADADASVQPEELTAYAARELKDYLPALEVSSGGGTSGAPAVSGTRYPAQGPAAGGNTKPATETATVKRTLDAKYPLPPSLKPKEGAAAR